MAFSGVVNSVACLLGFKSYFVLSKWLETFGVVITTFLQFKISEIFSLNFEKQLVKDYHIIDIQVTISLARIIIIWVGLLSKRRCIHISNNSRTYNRNVSLKPVKVPKTFCVKVFGSRKCVCQYSACQKERNFFVLIHGMA